MSAPHVHTFFHAASNTFSYVVADAASGRAAVVDCARDFDAASGRTGTASADALIAFVRERGYGVDWVLETHAHADHLSAAPHVQAALGGRIAIGAGIVAVQRRFVPLFDIGGEVATDGSQFDRLWRDGDTFAIGTLQARVIPLPGHTPDNVAYLIGDALFTGDSLFMPDAGTARCDFPDGDAAMLFRAIRHLFDTLPGDTRVFVCHDYGSGGRAIANETTLAAQRRDNVHVRDGIDEAAFVAQREARDATLAVPALLLPALQVNLRAGHLPPPARNGIRYVSIPLDTL